MNALVEKYRAAVKALASAAGRYDGLKQQLEQAADEKIEAQRVHDLAYEEMMSEIKREE